MATTRTKDVGVTKTTLAADTYLYGDGNTDGSHKILGSDVAKYVASEEGGNTLASLSGGKVPTAQLPWTSETFLGTSTVASLPAPGGLSAGEYYITTDSGTNHSVTFAAGDKAISDGTSYYAVSDGVRPIGEGGTGAPTAEGARTNLEVDSSDEVAETITNGQPSIYLPGGSGQQVSVAHDAALNFSDTTNTDDLPFTISLWLKSGEWSQTTSTRTIISKFDSNRGWRVTYFGDDLYVWKGDGTDVPRRRAENVMTGYNDQWVHLSFVFPGCGPNSDDDFTVPLDNFKCYRNGEDITSSFTATSDLGSYGGFYKGSTPNTSALMVGNQADGTSRAADLEFRKAQIFQSDLSAADVETIYRSGVPFELDQATAGGYVSDFTSDSVDGWTASTYASLDATATVGSDSDNLKIVSDGTASQQHSANRSNTAHTSGKAFRMTGEYYLPSGQTAVDGFIVFAGGAGPDTGSTFNSLTTDAWTSFEFEGSGTNTSGTLNISLRDGGSTTFNGVSGEYIAFRNIRFVETGAILDLDIPGTNGTTVPDRSGNGFNGTLNSMTVAGNVVGLPSTLAANNPNPSSGQALISVSNNGTEKFKVDDSGNVELLRVGDNSELTISSGSVTATSSYHSIDTQSDAASDDLDTIVAGDAGQILVISANNSARTVVAKDGTGNLVLAGDFSMDNTEDTLTLICDGTNWKEICRSNNGA